MALILMLKRKIHLQGKAGVKEVGARRPESRMRLTPIMMVWILLKRSLRQRERRKKGRRRKRKGRRKKLQGKRQKKRRRNKLSKIKMMKLMKINLLLKSILIIGERIRKRKKRLAKVLKTIF